MKVRKTETEILASTVSNQEPKKSRFAKQILKVCGKTIRSMARVVRVVKKCSEHVHGEDLNEMVLACGILIRYAMQEFPDYDFPFQVLPLRESAPSESPIGTNNEEGGQVR